MGVIMGQNLDQIISNVVKKVKKQALSIGSFHILHGGISFKAKRSGCTNIDVES